MMLANVTPTVELLKEVKVLNGFSDIELKQLISIGETQSFEPYSNIVIEGDSQGGIGFILDGLTGVFKNNSVDGTAYDLGHLSPGGFFGEMSLIGNNPRSATVRAITACRIFQITKAKFDQFIDQSAERKIKFLQNVILTLSQRLKQVDDDYVVAQYQIWRLNLKKKGKEAA